MIEAVVQWGTHTFLPLGGWGLFALSFADSSFSPIPPDVLLVPLVLAAPGLALWYAFLCTAASVLGAGFAYLVGRRVGRRLLAKLIGEEKITMVERVFVRWGNWAVGVTGFAPIPVYKEFTLSAGLFRLDWTGFILASILGRGGRFFLLALLLRAYGQPAVGYMSKNLITVTLATLGVAGLGYAAVGLVRNRRTWMQSHARQLWRSGKSAAERFLDRRFQVWEGYLLYFIAGWVAFVFTVTAFGKVVSEVFWETAPVKADLLILSSVHRLVTPVMTKLMLATTDVASAAFVTVWAVLLVAYFLGRRRFAEAGLAAAVTGGGGALIGVLKVLFHRPRPALFPHLVTETDFSFPSGHTTIATCFFGLLIYLLVRRHHRTAWLAPVLAVLIGLVGFSRIYLGVHWPTDVLGGYVVGGAWLLGCILVAEELRLRQSRRASVPFSAGVGQ